MRPTGSDAETHQGQWADPELAGTVHATGGRWPHLEEGLSGPVRGSDLPGLPTAWRLHPTKEDSDAPVGRAGVGAARWGRPGVDEPLASHGLEAGLLQPRTPPWQSPERWSPAHLPLAPARLGPNGPPAAVPYPQLARLDPAPSTPVLTVPGPLPHCSAVASLAPSPRPAAHWKPRPDVGTVACGGWWEEVAGGCPPGE